MVSGMTLEEIVAKRVKALRQARGWTVEELAAVCAASGAPGVTAAKLYRLERGERRPHLNDIGALAVALDVPLLVLQMPSVNVPVRLTDELAAPAQAVAEWATGRRPAPSGGKINSLQRAAAAGAFHRWLPYLTDDSQRPPAPDVDLAQLAGDAKRFASYLELVESKFKAGVEPAETPQED